ncbi:MAG: BrnT family toxin [Candidatus Omnitrophica bacterium]|nr:BrnT family toxin [Candidatus Omnitrophota bacterium]
MEILSSPIEFEWDKHNTEHVGKHKVKPGECEQVFFNIPLTVKIDLVHSRGEERYFALGKTNMGRTLVVIFTLRKTRIRVITARDTNKKERISHET